MKKHLGQQTGSAHKPDVDVSGGSSLKSQTVCKEVFSQPPIVHVLPLKMMAEVCHFHHSVKNNPGNHIVAFLTNYLEIPA